MRLSATSNALGRVVPVPEATILALGAVLMSKLKLKLKPKMRLRLRCIVGFSLVPFAPEILIPELSSRMCHGACCVVYGRRLFSFGPPRGETTSMPSLPLRLCDFDELDLKFHIHSSHAYPGKCAASSYG